GDRNSIGSTDSVGSTRSAGSGQSTESNITPSGPHQNPHTSIPDTSKVTSPTVDLQQPDQNKHSDASTGAPRRPVVPTQRAGEQGFSQQFVRPQQLLEGKDGEAIFQWLSEFQLEQYTANFLSAGYDVPTISRMTPEAESGQETLRRKAPAALDLVTIEPPAESSESTLPHTPKMSTFQDSELSSELQSAICSQYSGCQEGLTIKCGVGISSSQESIDARSRGSGRSQEPPSTPSSTSVPNSCSRESLASPDSSPAKERNIPEGHDQCPQPQPAFSFKYPIVPTKPKLSPLGSSPQKNICYSRPQFQSATLDRRSPGMAKKRTQSLSRYALSDGEPDEDEDDEAAQLAAVAMPSYATISRKLTRGQTPHNQSNPEQSVGRSHSFAVRARRKGPPPPPPKRLSSVNSSSASTDTFSDPPVVPPIEGLENGTVKNIALRLEAVSVVKDIVASCASDGSKLRPLSHSESCPATKSDLEEEDGMKDSVVERLSSPQNSSSECIPFAEEGNLTIKQRPKAGGPLKVEGALEPLEKSKPLPEFNLKESDTVKRRQKPKDKDQGNTSTHSGTTEGSGTQETVALRISETDVSLPCVEITNKLVKCPPPLAPKPHSPLSPARQTSKPQLTPTTATASGVTLSVVQSVAFASPPCSIAVSTSHEHTVQRGIPVAVPTLMEGSQDSNLKLIKTSSSLEEALKAVEMKLTLENHTSASHGVKSAGNILDDIGNMFDDLADQLDAMLD
ncbi:hypothetical protein DNTS_014309, partial [Danionella cerebrum]